MFLVTSSCRLFISLSRSISRKSSCFSLSTNSSIITRHSLCRAGLKCSKSSILWNRCLILAAFVDESVKLVHFLQNKSLSLSQQGASLYTAERSVFCWSSQDTANEMRRSILAFSTLELLKWFYRMFSLEGTSLAFHLVLHLKTPRTFEMISSWKGSEDRVRLSRDSARV